MAKAKAKPKKPAMDKLLDALVNAVTLSGGSVESTDDGIRVTVPQKLSKTPEVLDIPLTTKERASIPSL